MRSRLFKLFLVFMLIVGIFVNNKVIIKADDRNTEGLIVRNGDKFFEYVWADSSHTTLTRSSRSTMTSDDLDKLGLDISGYTPDGGINYVSIRVKNSDTKLIAPDDGSPIIESEIPIWIRSYDNESIRKLTFTTNYLNTKYTEPVQFTAIRCDANLRFSKIEVDIFPELENKYLSNTDDVFNGIVVHQHDDEVDGYQTHGIKSDTSTIRIFGTRAIDVSKDKDYDVEDNGSIELYESNYYLNGVYPDPHIIDYDDCEPIVQLESRFLICKGSYVTIDANAPERITNDEGGSDSLYIEEESILETYSLTLQQNSSLIIHDANYKYERGISAGEINVIDSNLSIDGALVGLMYVNPDEKGGGKKEHLVGESESDLKIPNPGFFFEEASFSITSLFEGIELITKNKNPSNVPLEFRYKSGNKVSNTIRIMGDKDETIDLDIVGYPIALINLTNVDQQFSLNVLKEKYVFYSSDVSSFNVEPKYVEEFSFGNILKYRAMRMDAVLESRSVLTINNYDHQVLYINGTPQNPEISALKVTYNARDGYTINVLDDYQFIKSPDTGLQTFIGCSDANLKIVGNKKLSFVVHHSADERPTDGFVYILVDSAHNTEITGESEVKPLKIEVSEDGTLPTDGSPAYSFLSGNKDFQSTSSNVSTSEGMVSLDYVDLQAKTYSNLFTLISDGLSINHSNIFYGSACSFAISKSLNIIKAITFKLLNSNLEITGNDYLCSNEDNTRLKSTAIFIRDSVLIDNCKRVSISNLDCGANVSGKKAPEGQSAPFLLTNSSLDINCNKLGIVASGCLLDVYDGNNIHIFVNKVIYDDESGLYMNPAIKSSSYTEDMIKVPKGAHIIGISFEGTKKDITSTKNLGNYKVIDVATSEPESDKTLTIATHDLGELTLYSDDDPEESDQYKVYYDEDFDSFVVILKEDFDFERKKGDKFYSFVKCKNAGFILKGDVTVTFTYDLEDAYDQYQSNWFKCFDIDEQHDFIIEGLSDDERMKIVMEETTSTDKLIDEDKVVNSVLFHSHSLSEGEESSAVLFIKNTDIQANTFGQLLSLGSHNTRIINSNINFEFLPLNFKTEKPVINKTCFQTSKDIEIIDSNIEVIGDELINNFGDKDQIDVSLNGAMISQGSVKIESTTGEHHIRIKDYLYGIGAYGNISIKDMNLDVEGFRGGVGSALGGCLISLSSSEGYIKIKSDVNEQPSMDVYKVILPAVFGRTGAAVIAPEGSCVYAYDIDHNKEIYDQRNMFNYVYVTIQEENAPIPEPKDIKEIRPFKGPTDTEPGQLPYYQDENGYYYADPEGHELIGTYEALQEWLLNSSIPILKYKGSLVTLDNKEKKYDPIEKIIVPVTEDTNTYVLMCEEEKKNLEFKYLIINGSIVPSDMYDLAVGDIIAIRLKPEYINSLIVGSNVNAYIVTESGSAFTSFKIEKKHVDPPYNPGYVTPKTGIK